MGSLKLPILKPGDVVSLIAPARAVSPEEMEPFIHWLKNHGLKVNFGSHLYGRNHQFSGTDFERAADFRSAWLDPAVKAIFCGRGGYGCMRLLPYLGNEIWDINNNTVLAGFSDITTLHMVLNSHGFESLHAPMAINFFEPKRGTEENIERLEEVLFGGKVEIELSDNEILHKATFEGEIVGGNLSLIYASLGTPEQLNTSGKILFLEDLDEYLYHIDRMLVSLKRAGMLSNLKALIIGGMDKMNDNIISFGLEAEEIISQHTTEYGYPVIFGFPAGHGLKNFSFKLGAYTTFDGSILKQP